MDSLTDIRRLMIYEWCDELGELPCAAVRATGEKVRLDGLAEGDIMEFDGLREVVISGHYLPLCGLSTMRRARDSTGIELISRGQAGRNKDGKPFHTVYPFDDYEIASSQGKGYYVLDKLLKRYGL
jgi:hypothetical protein